MHLVFQRTRVLLLESGHLYLPERPPPGAVEPHGGTLLLELGGTPLRVVALPDDLPPPPGTVFHGLRTALGILGPEEARWAGRGRQLLEWRQDHRFCGRCGGVTELSRGEAALRCPRCGLAQFPRVAPAVIVLVHDGERLLLGRGRHLPEGMYSTLAGFVEPGESAEETVHREILEEAGVTVETPRYFGSQSWPFPHSLMLGFHARFRSGEIRRDEDELEDVRWFARDELPLLPPHISIARQLIDDFLLGRAES